MIKNTHSNEYLMKEYIEPLRIYDIVFCCQVIELTIKVFSMSVVKKCVQIEKSCKDMGFSYLYIL